jgi:putative ABC transport system substrate-binding protein
MISLGIGWLGAPLVVLAQKPPPMRRIGVLTSSSPARDRTSETFKQRLRELGYVEGKTIVIDYLSADGRYERLAALAAELVRRKVDVIFANATSATIAAKNATRTIPVVFIGVADGVGQGLVRSLARPGGNLTGMSILNPQTSVKMMQLLKEVVPAATRFALLSNPTNESHPPIVAEMQAAARQLRVETSTVFARSPAELENAFAEAKQLRADGLAYVSDSMFGNNATALAALAATHRLPVIGGSPAYPEHGGLLSYGANRTAYIRRGAELVDKILKGTKPPDIPVEQPTRFELVVNLKTAKALGITIPSTILVWAETVIE